MAFFFFFFLSCKYMYLNNLNNIIYCNFRTLIFHLIFATSVPTISSISQLCCSKMNVTFQIVNMCYIFEVTMILNVIGNIFL